MAWNERAEEILSLYLSETNQEPTGVVISLPVLKEHFGGRISENDCLLLKSFLRVVGRLSSGNERRGGIYQKYRIIPVHRRPLRSPQEYKIEKRRPRWGNSRRGDQGS